MAKRQGRKGKRWKDSHPGAAQSVLHTRTYGPCLGPRKQKRRWFVDRIAAELVGLRLHQVAEECTKCGGWHLTDPVVLTGPGLRRPSK